MPHRRSWHSSPPLLSPPLLIILFPILTITLLFLAVPPLLSAGTRLLRPVSVKTSSDSLNILLVVFAILCGVFARRNHDEPPTNINDTNHDVVSDRNAAFSRVTNEGQSQWYGFQEDRKVYDNEESNNLLQSPATAVNRFGMRRNSSSYPDLRQWETADHRYKFRFFDDFEIDKQFRSPAREHFSAVDLRKRSPESPPREPILQPQQEQEDPVKEIPVDTFEIRPSSPPPVKSTPPPPPPPPPLESARRNALPMNQKRERHESEITVEVDEREFTTIRSPPPAPPTPAPPSVKVRSERKSEKKKSNVKREIAMVWASVLSNQRKKKKKQRAKNNHDHHSDDNVDELTNTSAPPETPPPPPPPPPPPSVFHSFFRKGLGKSKKIHSVSPPPPPPPPPSKRKNRIPTPPSPPPEPPRRRNHGRPPLPSRTVNFNDQSVNAGNQSPLIPVPPPPPPFKMTAMKFVVRGDYVKIRSNQSSRCSSPEREEINVSSETTINNAVNNGVRDRNGDVDGSVFCPSPDVNVKAATFIARLRGEWRLEKLNSLKEKIDCKKLSEKIWL